MSTYYETGHSKNVANLEDLISYCVGYGATYNPSKTSIKIAGLTTLLATSKSNIQAVNTTLTAFHNSTNAREIAFEPLRPLGTKILNALLASGASDQTINDFKTLNRKVQGKRAGSKLTKADSGKTAKTIDPNAPVVDTPKTISSAQLSYSSLIEHIATIITILSTEPTYLPNENDLKIATLIAKQADMTAKNTALATAYTAVSNSRINRDKVLYKETTGLVPIATDVKKYIKAVFGASSAEYRQVKSIEFTKPRK